MTKLFNLLILTTTVTTASASLVPMDVIGKQMAEFLDLYNMYNACFGPAYAKHHVLKIRNAMKTCQMKQVPVYVKNELIDHFKYTHAENQLTNRILLRPSKSRLNVVRMIKSRDFYKNKVDDYKINYKYTVGNLSCVLEEMNIFNSSGGINQHKFSPEGIKQQFETSQIVFDEVFLKSLYVGYKKCAKIAEQGPNTHMNRSTLAKATGYRHEFLTCHMKLENDLCYKKQIYESLKYYQNLDTEYVDVGIPGDKFDIALGVWTVLRNSANDEIKGVHDFFWRRQF